MVQKRSRNVWEVIKGSSWFNKFIIVQESSRRTKKIQDSSKGFMKVSKSLRRFHKVHKV